LAILTNAAVALADEQFVQLGRHLPLIARAVMRAVFEIPYNPVSLEVQDADYNIVQNNGMSYRSHFQPSSLIYILSVLPHLLIELPPQQQTHLIPSTILRAPSRPSSPPHPPSHHPTPTQHASTFPKSHEPGPSPPPTNSFQFPSFLDHVRQRPPNRTRRKRPGNLAAGPTNAARDCKGVLERRQGGKVTAVTMVTRRRRWSKKTTSTISKRKSPPGCLGGDRPKIQSRSLQWPR
jgi:hypothetical protein